MPHPTLRLTGRRPWLGPLARLAGICIVALLLTACQVGNPAPPPDRPETPIAQVAPSPGAPDAQATAAAEASTAETPELCGQAPAGWVEQMVDVGDTLSGLAERSGVDVATIQRANCLTSDAIFVGQLLWLPVAPTPSPTPCVRSIPESWGGYLVRPGDTLEGLAAIRGVLPGDIVRANCLASNQVEPGSLIFLPTIILQPTPALAPTAAVAVAPVVIAPAQPVPAPPPAGAAPSSGAAAPESGGGEGDTTVRPVRFLAPPDALPIEFPAGPPNRPGECPKDGNAHLISAITVPPNALLRITRGERANFFFCGFDDVSSLRVRVDGPSGPGEVPVPSILLFTPDQAWRDDLGAGLLDRELGNLQEAANEMGYQGVVTLYPTCQQPPGDYELILEDGSGSRDSPDPIKFNLRTPPGNGNRILVAPKIAEPGAAFDVFYCDYPAHATVRVLLYHADTTDRVYRDDGSIGRATAQLRDFWIIRTNDEGWAHERIQFAPSDPAGMYHICDGQDLLGRGCDQQGDRFIGRNTFWLFP